MTTDNDDIVEIEWSAEDEADFARHEALPPKQQQREIDALLSEMDVALKGLDAVPAAPRIKPKVSKLIGKLLASHPILTDDAVKSMPPPVWFIDKLIPAGPRTLLHGAGGALKSFVVLDWMLSAASGVDWLGHRVKPGKVLYIAGEGIAGVGKRIDAWEATHGPVPDGRAYFMAEPINLLRASEDEVEAWATIFAHAHYDYVVVDTVHTAMAGGEENSATEIGTLFANATKIAGGNEGAQVFFVHHDPKPAKESPNQKRTARGSSSFRDSVDVCLGIHRVNPDELLQSVLWCDKVRDAESFRDIKLQLKVSGDGEHSSLYISGKVETTDTPSTETQETLDYSDDARRLIDWIRKNQKRAKHWGTLDDLRDDALVGGCLLNARQIERAHKELRASGLLTRQDKIWREAPNPTPATT